MGDDDDNNKCFEETQIYTFPHSHNQSYIMTECVNFTNLHICRE